MLAVSMFPNVTHVVSPRGKVKVYRFGATCDRNWRGDGAMLFILELLGFLYLLPFLLVIVLPLLFMIYGIMWIDETYIHPLPPLPRTIAACRYLAEEGPWMDTTVHPVTGYSTEAHC